MTELFQASYPALSVQRPVVEGGQFQLADNFVDIDNVLFDSGAMQADYISKGWVDAHREEVTRRLRPAQSRVKMADNKIVVDVMERLRTLVTFTMRVSGEVVSGVIDFWICLDQGAFEQLLASWM